MLLITFTNKCISMYHVHGYQCFKMDDVIVVIFGKSLDKGKAKRIVNYP